MGAIESVRNNKKDIPSMIEELKNIVFHSQSQAERDLAIKFLTTIGRKKEPYFQIISLILSDALLTNPDDTSNYLLILESWSDLILQTTNRELAYQAIDKWNKTIVKLDRTYIFGLTLYSFEFSVKYPEKFLLTFQSIAKFVADDGRDNSKRTTSSYENDFVSKSVPAILKLPEKYQKKITEFLQSNISDMKNSENLRQIYFKVYGDIANNILSQVLDESQ